MPEAGLAQVVSHMLPQVQQSPSSHPQIYEAHMLLDLDVISSQDEACWKDDGSLLTSCQECLHQGNWGNN